MSSEVFVRGTLKKVDTKGKTTEEYVTDLLVETKEGFDSLSDFDKEMEVDEYIYENYITLGGELWEWVNKKTSYDTTEYYCELTENGDGTIGVVTQFYDGGTCEKEMIEEEYDRRIARGESFGK